MRKISRRSFLKAATVACALTALTPAEAAMNLPPFLWPRTKTEPMWTP